MDYYDVLGVARDASTDDIERAFKTMARKVHPDRNSEDVVRADAQMKQLNQIRETLSDPLLRAAYDDGLRRERQQSPRSQSTSRERPEEPPWDDRGPGNAPPAARSAPSYVPHPHVAPFLRTQAEVARASSPPLRADTRPGLVLLAATAALALTAAVMWSSDDPVPPLEAEAAPLPAKVKRAKTEGVLVLRGDTKAAAQAVRKTAKVVPMGATFDEVIRRFGPPDKVEPGTANGDLVLLYDQVRVQLHDGRVVGGSP